MASEPNPTPDPASQPKPAPSPIDVNPTVIDSTASNRVTTEGSNDKLMAALTYPIPLVGIVVLLSDSMKNNSFLRVHAVQSIALGVVLLIASFIIGLIPIIGCITPLLWLGITIYYAYQAYGGKNFSIPFVTDFCRNQKWI
jgi:uncharacterized membrane protein